MPTNTRIEPYPYVADDRDIERQRSRAVTTAWLLAAVAAAIFAAFVLSSVLGR